MTPIVFAHGLEGSPNGRKIQTLRSAGFSVDAPDGRGLMLADRVDGIERAMRGRKVLLIGSSYGGLAAAYLASVHPERLVGLLLLAPALHRTEKPVFSPESLMPPQGVPTVVIHGIRDAVVPVDASRRYAARGSVDLIEVDDDHRLVGALSQMVASTERLLQINETTLDDI